MTTMTLPEWRNPKYNAVGTIDMEIRLGDLWFPFTADPNDVEEQGRALYDAAIEFGEVADCPPPSTEGLQKLIVTEVQARLDAFAQARGYDSILSACTYAPDPLAQFAAEGHRAVELRSQTWAKLYQMLGEVQAGTRPIPTGYADIAGELPALEWE
jgi:hypothetical protein